ncbi:MAG: precorrin-2 C(20)-methyltransferase [Methanosphaera sp.]|jgi:precorrin-2/cobalt-factor-2 C20-methyltransferase|uniref:precorrin-2 C(20)-methyltransferase n=1 Tax=Methanosphaera TaxID=2316 RepID=UPI002380B447|nr:precorrin-2 C(20)-methyltransferase [Candidatus Methanosphaera massiliense]MDD6285684.1 precorrin-2 C(20)-methyltransferase [Methanobacteriaceae archaeon]MDE4078000.1 precorrin-2 C(20)-methyltransferase [Candidatus Methanosphaera massiliense]MDY2744850.1 precorrin-2 C(20)-methyltransferase [Methanosphaera sp.]
MAIGKLYGIGVGPGDPDLLTIKAAKIIKNTDIIFAPKSKNGKPSVALNIAQQIIDEREEECEILQPLFPMTEDKDELDKSWDEATNMLYEKLATGLNAVFVTLGDPTVFSTFSYISTRLQAKGVEVEIIPGITSFTACASRAGIQLTEQDDIMAVVPQVDERLAKILPYVDTVVAMKTSRHLDVLEDCINKDPREKEIVSVQNCTMDNENIVHGFVDNKKYFSTSIIKFKK